MKKLIALTLIAALAGCGTVSKQGANSVTDFKASVDGNVTMHGATMDVLWAQQAAIQACYSAAQTANGDAKDRIIAIAFCANTAASTNAVQAFKAPAIPNRNPDTDGETQGAVVKNATNVAGGVLKAGVVGAAVKSVASSVSNVQTTPTQVEVIRPEIVRPEVVLVP